MLLYLPSKIQKNVKTGAIVPIATMDKFCKNNRLYSGNGRDRGDTAQYDTSAMLTVANITFWMESNVILVLAPAIRTFCSDSLSISCSTLSSPTLIIGTSAIATTVDATAVPSQLPLDTEDIDANRGDMNADSTPILFLPPIMDIALLLISVVVISRRFAAALEDNAFSTAGVDVVNV